MSELKWKNKMITEGNFREASIEEQCAYITYVMLNLQFDEDGFITNLEQCDYKDMAFTDIVCPRWNWQALFYKLKGAE